MFMASTDLCPCPRRLKVPNDIWNAELVDDGPWDRTGGYTDAQKAGLKYEMKFGIEMSLSYPEYKAGQWIRYWEHSHGPWSFAQPDGLLVGESRVTIFEVKLKHTPDAWWQLRKLYTPLVEYIYPDRPISVVEVCRYCDASTAFPEEVEFLTEVEEASPDRFGVLLWRP